MNNFIFDILRLLNIQNQPQQNNNSQTQNNPSYFNYPHESMAQMPNNQPQQNNENNLFPILMSLLGKNSDFNKSFSQSAQKKEEVKRQSSSPDDEILL